MTEYEAAIGPEMVRAMGGQWCWYSGHWDWDTQFDIALVCGACWHQCTWNDKRFMEARRNPHMHHNWGSWRGRMAAWF